MQNLWRSDNLITYVLIKLFVILLLLSILYLASSDGSFFHPFYFSPFFAG